jgi:TPR repeat protein
MRLKFPLPSNALVARSDRGEQRLIKLQKPSKLSPMKGCMHHMRGTVQFWAVQFLLLIAGSGIPGLAQNAGVPAQAELRAAAESGDAKAQDKLGDFYSMRFDYPHALTWYRKAAEQGVANSQFGLGRMLMRKGVDWSGKITSRADVDEAIKWYARSADQGHGQAQIDLGRFCEKGELVTQDHAEAYKWYALAAKGNAGEATTVTGKAYRDGLVSRMTPAQLADAQKRVEKFLAAPKVAVEASEPAFAARLSLNSISGPEKHRVALINDRSFEAGKENQIKIGEQVIKIQCLEIRKDSVLIKAGGMEKVKELKLKRTK